MSILMFLVAKFLSPLPAVLGLAPGAVARQGWQVAVGSVVLAYLVAWLSWAAWVGEAWAWTFVWAWGLPGLSLLLGAIVVASWAGLVKGAIGVRRHLKTRALPG